MASLLDEYRGRIERGALRPDPEQARAATALDRLLADLSAPNRFWHKARRVKGVYLHGGVGRGKSMLMDMLVMLAATRVPTRRIHFHQFMIETHDWLHAHRKDSVDDLLPRYAKHVARQVRLLCFDEFHVTDVADAMILSRLFTALFANGVIAVATSNWPPDRLYEGGLQRERFLPFIALLKSTMEVVHLDSDTDYRAAAIHDLETYLHPLDAHTQAKADRFFTVFSDGKPVQPETITVKGRDINVKAAGGAARFSFADLCERPHGAEDYIRIGERFHTVFIEHIPRLGYDRANETKRLMTLIDVLYDMRRRVIITAEAAPEKLYHGDRYAFEFERTISRLNEMQSSSYAKEAA